MINKNEMSLGEAIEAVFRRYGLQDKVDGARLIQSWEPVVGQMIASHTTDLYLKNKTLFVYLDSDALRHELSFAKSLIIKKLNAEAGKEIIDNIVFS
jgi:predicted nucleic acid-binding Zn ribbon protein